MTDVGARPRDTWLPLGDVLADVLDSVLSPLALLTSDFRFVSVNRAYCEVVGRSADDMIGEVVFEVFPEPPRQHDSGPGLRQSLALALETGCPHSMPLLRYDVAPVHGGDPVERYWHVSNVPIPHPDGSPWMVLNNPEEVTEYIDERLRLEAVGADDIEANSSSSKLQAVDSAFTAAISRLQNLNDLASGLVGATDADAIGRALLSDGLAMAGAVGGSFLIVDGNRMTMVDHGGVADEIVDRWRSFLVNPGTEPFSDALGDGAPRFFPTRQALLDDYPGLAADVEQQAHEAWAVLPLRVGDHVTGAIGLIYDTPHPFTAPVRLVLFTLANLVAQAASRAQLLHEQSVAMRSVEEAFESALDPVPGLTVSALYRPASATTGAGGDWYDVINLDEPRTLIAIGDVANHGPIAVGEMARTRATVHALALQGLSPAAIATQADCVLARVSATFTTSVVAIYDSDSRVFTWTTAGHPHPILRAADGTTEFLVPTHGAPLGAGVENDYGSSSIELHPGDTIVLYTDGLVERVDEPIDEGLERLRVAVAGVEVTADLAARLFDRLIVDRRPDDVAVLTLACER